MKYTKEQRLEIGRKIYEGELTTAMAANKYDINLYTEITCAFTKHPSMSLSPSNIKNSLIRTTP